jgi:hypothetical protein
MLRAVLLSLLLSSPVAAQNVVEYSYSSSTKTLWVTIKGNSYRDVTVWGATSTGGSVSVVGQLPAYTIPVGCEEIMVDLHSSCKTTSEGFDLEYSNHASVSLADSFRFHVRGSEKSSALHIVLTGAEHDYINVGNHDNADNFVASGRGADFIVVHGESYVFSGEGGVSAGDWVYWDGTCVVYTADDTQQSQYGIDDIFPEPDQNLTRIDSGPLTGWN